jgi:hypothetical protein
MGFLSLYEDMGGKGLGGGYCYFLKTAALYGVVDLCTLRLPHWKRESFHNWGNFQWFVDCKLL